ncbi:MAG: nucleotidyltransferase domain-containing protein, partial [Anaerolineales bacterium]
KELAPIASQFGLRLIVLFGSAARGKMHKESDIDVGVLTDRPLTFNRRLKLWYQLASLFRADIDFAVLNHAVPLFGFEVARDGKVLFERDPYVWENWRSYKIRQFWDTKKFRDDLERYIARCAEEMEYANTG